MTNCPPRLRGDLSKWLCEINTGVYVGNVSSRVRDAVWDRVCQNLKNGQADYYFGACKTGGGGALAMAIALLGMNQCATVSMPGKMLSEDEILAQVKAGKKAYGFTDQHIEKVVPIILKGLGF